MQRPIFRLVGQGPAWVACFFILSGFVNALKPVKLARAGNTESALSNLAVSSFRRSFRLFLPATTATIISWFITQLGAYETARQTDAYWMYSTSPAKSVSWWDAIGDLGRAIQTTWCYRPHNPYDQPQWALLYLLQGSMFVFTALLVTINLTPRFRMASLALLCLWSINWGSRLVDRTLHGLIWGRLLTYVQALCGFNVFAGVLLAEFNQTDYPFQLSQLSPLLAPPLVFISLVLMSFPADFQGQAPWSRFLMNLHYKIAPESADVARFWPAVGAQLLVATIICSPQLRRGLSHTWFLWLGKISFPLYLLHGTFIRTVLAWLLTANQSLTQIRDDDGLIYPRYPMPGVVTFLIVMPVWLVILFSCTHFWAVKLEPWFGIITKEAETIMFGKKDRTSPLPVRQD